MNDQPLRGAHLRARLTRLALLMGGTLLALFVVVMVLATALPEVPAVLSLPTRPRPTATPRPTRAPVEPSPASTVAASPAPLTPQATSSPQPTSVVYLPAIVVQPTLTLTPSPSPVFAHPPPTPNWPNAIPGLTASKMGLHVVRNADPYVMEFVRRIHPRVMKVVDDVGWATDIKAASSATVVVGRFVRGQDESWVHTLSPEEAAQRYIAANLAEYRLNPGVDYWEGWNEFVPVDDARMSWYARFEAARACEMQALGLRAAVGGFSVGVPEYNHMALFLPALEAAYRCGGIFTLHEYNSPTFQCGIGMSDARTRIPGAPALEGVLLGYHTLRYRYWYDGYLKSRGMGDLPLVISELGIQAGPPGGPCDDPGSAGGHGWKGYTDWWVRQGYGPDGPQAYVNLLAWYDAELRKDPYVIGATIFTAGAQGADFGAWNDFDVHDAIIPLAHYAARQQ